MKNIHKLKHIGWLIFIPILVLLTGFGLKQMLDSPDETDQIQTDIEEWGKFSGLNIQTKTEESSSYSTSISTPTTTKDSINEVIHHWIDKQEEDFFVQLEQFEDPLNNEVLAHLNVQLDVGEITDQIYNLIFKTYSYVGGADGISSKKVYTIDLKDGRILSLTDLIDFEKEQKLDAFYIAVMNSLKKDDELVEKIEPEILADALDQYETLEWSIDESSLVLYFDEYEITPNAEGIIQIPIPLADLTNIVNEKAIEQLELATVLDQQEQKKKEEKEKKKQEEKEKNKKEKKEQSTERSVNPDDKYIALTFDDGPSGDVTPDILNTLKEYDAVATFFMLGSQVEYYPDLAKEVANLGHEIANHTVNHVDLTKVQLNAAREEIAKSRATIEEITGVTTKLVRPPYGAYDESTLTITAEQDESIILWSVDSLDWKDRKVSAIENRVLQSAISGSIVLMHDIHPTTAEALPQILDALTAEGYSFVTVSQLIELQEKNTLQVIRGTNKAEEVSS